MTKWCNKRHHFPAGAPSSKCRSYKNKRLELGLIWAWINILSFLFPISRAVFYFLSSDSRCQSCCAAVKTIGVQYNSAAETQNRWWAKENIWTGKLPEPEEQALRVQRYDCICQSPLDGAAVWVWLCSEQRSCRPHRVTADDSLPLTEQISVTLNGFTGSSQNLFSPPPTGASWCGLSWLAHSLCWWWCPKRFDSASSTAAVKLWAPRGH